MQEQPGFWFGLSLLLDESNEEEPSQLGDERSAALEQAAEHWQACVRSCNDPWVLGRVLSALDRASPTKQQLCWLAATLLERSLLTPAADSTRSWLGPLRRITQHHPGLLLHSAGALERLVVDRACSGAIRSVAEQQALQARQVELLLYLMDSPTAAVGPLAEALARGTGTAAAASPAPGSKLSELVNGVISVPHAPLPARLSAARLLSLCCASSLCVFKQYRGLLETVLQREASADLVYVAACGLFEAFFLHLEHFGAAEWGCLQSSIKQGLACPVPGIQLPAALGACRVVLHAWDAAAAAGQEAVAEGLLQQLAAMLSSLQGQLGPVDRSSEQGQLAAGADTTALQLSSPHAFRPRHLLRLLTSCFAQLAAMQPQALLQTLCSLVCGAVDSGELQVDIETGELSSTQLAGQAAHLKAQCRCLVAVLREYGSDVSEQAVCTAISDRLVVATPEGVGCWLL